MSPDEIFGSLVGQTVPGGCEDCDAEQVMAADPARAGVYVLQIKHDDACPTYRRIRRDGRAR